VIEKNESTETFSESITKILVYHDPAELGQSSVPKDEYSPEADVIISKLRDVNDMRELRWAIYHTFESYFFKENILPASDKCYRLIAKEIWDMWHEFK